VGVGVGVSVGVGSDCGAQNVLVKISTTTPTLSAHASSYVRNDLTMAPPRPIEPEGLGALLP
jgi:hypothetical protein